MRGEERSAQLVDKKIGQRVRARRLEIGMSQERLAELLGVTFQQVQKYEKGVNRIAASRLFDTANALDMPVGKFFEGLDGRGFTAKYSGDTSKMDDVLSTPEGANLIALFSSIKSVIVRRRVVDLVKALSSEEASASKK